jgi:hypothetical protein
MAPAAAASIMDGLGDRPASTPGAVPLLLGCWLSCVAALSACWLKSGTAPSPARSSRELLLAKRGMCAPSGNAIAPAAAARIIEGLGLRPGAVVKLPSLGREGVVVPDVTPDRGWSEGVGSGSCCCCVVSNVGGTSSRSSETSGERTLSSATRPRLLLGCSVDFVAEAVAVAGAGMHPAAAARAMEGVNSRLDWVAAVDWPGAANADALLRPDACGMSP